VDIYLDHNATTPVLPQVAAAMADALARTGNPSSVHRFGRLVRRSVDEAREAVAALAGVSAANVVFTSGGSEANNLAIRGFAERAFVSAVEHASVLDAVPDVYIIPVDGNGVVYLPAVREILAGLDGTVVVSVMLANNETGVIQPVAQIAEIAHAAGALFHCDAIQAVGKRPLNLCELGADLMSVSAHKLGGPQGIGALVVRDGLDPEPLIRGGGQERRRRAGTENVPGIVGFGVAAQHAQRAAIDYSVMLAGLRDDLERRLLAAAPDATIHGAGVERLANTSCIGLPGVSGEIQVMTLDLAGVAVSAGSACSSGKVTPSHVLSAMGLDDEAARSAVRVSLGTDTKAEQIDRFVEVWSDMAQRRDTGADIRRSVA
jgi:cysteine desulfurase